MLLLVSELDWACWLGGRGRLGQEGMRAGGYTWTRERQWQEQEEEEEVLEDNSSRWRRAVGGQQGGLTATIH